MPKTVNIQGVGQVSFPDDMDDRAIQDAIEVDILKTRPVGAEKTGPLPGIPKPALPTVTEEGALSFGARQAGQVVDSFMRTGSEALYSSARGTGAGIEAIDRQVQDLNPLVPKGSGPSLVGKAGAKLREFGDRAIRENPASVAQQAVNKNILDNPEVLTDPVFWAQIGGNVTGSMMSMLPAAIPAGNAAARTAALFAKRAEAAKVAAATGGAAAGAFVETFFDAGNSYQDAIEAGASPELAAKVAARVFAAEYPTTLAFNQIGIFNPETKSGIRHALMSAIGEGGQEVGQGLAQRTSEWDVTGKMPKEGIWGPTPTEFLSGLMGGPIGSAFTGPMMDEAGKIVTKGAAEAAAEEGAAPTQKPAKQPKQPKAAKATPAATTTEQQAAPTSGITVEERGANEKGTPIYSVGLDQVEATGPYSNPDEDTGEEPPPPSDPSKPIFARYDQDSGKLLVSEGADLVEAARKRGDSSIDVVIVNHKRAPLLNVTKKAAASEAPSVSTVEGGNPPVSAVSADVGSGVPGETPIAPVSDVQQTDGDTPGAASQTGQQQPVTPSTPPKTIRDYRAADPAMGERSPLLAGKQRPRGENAVYAEVTSQGKQVFERAKAKAAAAKQNQALSTFEKLGKRAREQGKPFDAAWTSVQKLATASKDPASARTAFEKGFGPVETKPAPTETKPPVTETSTPVETPTTPVEKQEVAATPLKKVVDRLRSDLKGNTFPKNGLELAGRYQQETGKGIVESGGTMKDAYDAMETAVNQHIAEDIGPEVLAMPVSDAIQRMNEFTQALPTQTVRTTEQVEFQQFSTPPALAMLAAKAANIQPGETVLEPSAGTGGLAAWAKAAGATVETNELAPRRRELLGMSGYSPTGHNAERIRDMRPELKPDVVLMNPPFSATAGRLSTNKNTVGYQHVISALQSLKPGGRLVAILGRGAAPDAPNAAKFWQDITKQGATVRANVGLSGKNYAKYGTHFDNRLLIVDKAKVEGTPVTGEFEKLEDAYNAISGVLSRGPVGASPGRAEGVSGEESAAGKGPVDGDRNRDGRQDSGTGVEPSAPLGSTSSSSTDAGSGPATGPQQPAKREPASSDSGSGGDAGGVVGAAGISADDLIAQVTANLQAQGYTLAPSSAPAPTTQQQQPKAAKPRAPKPKAAPAAAPSPTTKANPLESAAEAARQRLRAKMNGTSLNSGIDPQDLVDIATIGAKHIVDGATAFKEWAGRMRSDVGDLVNWMAAASQQTADQVLRQIHQVARSVAKKFGVDAEATPAEEKAADIKTGKAERTGEEEDEGDGPFATYRPSKLRTGKSHKEATGTGLVETANMASVEPPDITYKPSLPQSLIESGKISDAQLEAIVYAGQAHSQVMGDGRRAGFMIGDGTGVGKGTEAAGIVLDNWRQGRKKTLWLSLKSGLVKQAQRDLDWVESGIQTKMANDWNFGEDIQHEGVVFASYLMLTQQSSDGSKGTRLEQILKWKPDVIIMDESHAMKNAVGTAALSEDGDKNILATEGSKSGLAGIQLDEGLPDARVVYLSATGFTDVINVGYASRLGLWGPGTSFTDFKDFMVQIERGGLGAMELVARELKAMGRYVARSISYDGVEYREVEAKLNPGQKQMYDSAVQAWQVILANIDKAIDATTNEGEGRARGLARARALSQFWSRNLAFYRQLLVTMKVPTLIQEIQTALDQNKSVFLDLVSTSEASANRGLSKAVAEGTDFADLDLSAKSIIRDFLDKAFPIYLTEEYELESGGKAVRTVKDAKGDPVVSQEALELREKLKRDLDQIKLPKSPIDEIIDYFGDNQVAEISGRKARVVEDPNTGKPVEQKRVKPKGAVAKDVNDWERQQFMNGSKRIAIATAAGGTGFDFHADKRVKNQQRRVHITIEPSWSADAQMQKYGRTHRTNQSSAPEYVLVATDMGGEKRFISAIAARLSSLGALTRGERKAGGASATLEKYNIENEYGQSAVNFVLSQIANPDIPAQFVKDVSVRLRPLPAELKEYGSDNILALLGITKNDAQNGIPVTQFLNRLANTPSAIQGALFDQLMDTFDDIMKAVKESGIYDDGTIRLKALEAKIKSEEVLREYGGSPTKHVVVEATFPITYHQFADVRWHLQPGSVPLYASQVVPGLYRNKRSGQLWAVRESREAKFDAETGRVVTMASAIGTRKNSARSFPADQLGDAFDKVATIQKENWDELARMWNDEVATLPRTETDDVHLITGAVLQVWKQLQGTGKLDIVTVSGRGGEPVTGIRLGRQVAKDTVAILKGEADFSPQTFFDKVWNNNQTVQLTGATIRKTRIMGESVIAVQAADGGGVRALEGMGLQSQQTAAGQQFFIPVPRDPSESDIERAVNTLGKVLQRFPPKVEKPDPQPQQQSRAAKPAKSNNKPAKPFKQDVYLGSGIGALQQAYERMAQELGPVLRSKLSALHMSNPKQLGKAISREALIATWDTFRSLEKRIEREGGAKLMKLLNMAEDRGEVAAGQRLARLVDAGLSKLNENEARNLVDILQGRPGTIALNQKVTDAAKVVGELLDEIGQEAEDIGVLVRRLVENPSTGEKESVRVQFEKRSNYFPHVIRNVDALRFGPVRADVIANIIRLDLLSKMKNAPSAEEFVDAYIDWVDNGGRQKKLLDYLVASGQFADADEAYAVMLLMRQSVKRSGSMEYSREINFPLWDPDPRRVLPQWVASQSIRLAQIELFGQDNEVIKRQIQKIGKAGNNAKWVRAHVDRILGHINEAEDPETKVSRFFRAIQGFRLGVAATANIWQGPLNSLLKADLPSVYYGTRSAFSSAGRRFAIESGATIEPILHESVKELAGSSRALEKYLHAVGFTASERLNRVIAANTGAEYARRLVGRAKLGDKAAVRGLAELGLEPHVVIANGLSGQDVLMAAKKFSDLTQFRARPQDMPAFASTPYGRVFWQFKQFSYKQTTLVYDSLIGEARRGEFGSAFRNAFILAVVFGIAGEAAKDLRELIYAAFSGKWRDRPAPGLRRWLENISAVGALGFLGDIVGGKYQRGGVESLAGPTLTMAGKDIDALKPGSGTPMKGIPDDRRGILPTRVQKVVKAAPLPFPVQPILERVGVLDKPKP